MSIQGIVAMIQGSESVHIGCLVLSSGGKLSNTASYKDADETEHDQAPAVSKHGYHHAVIAGCLGYGTQVYGGTAGLQHVGSALV